MVTQKLPWMLLHVIKFHLIVIWCVWPALRWESVSHTIQYSLIVVRVSRRFMACIINTNFGVSIATDCSLYWPVKTKYSHRIITTILMSHDSQLEELRPLPCLTWENLFLPLIFKKDYIVFICSWRFPKTPFLLQGHSESCLNNPNTGSSRDKITPATTSSSPTMRGK